jgi:thiol-disulfide isomerase/thioredoxin
MQRPFPAPTVRRRPKLAAAAIAATLAVVWFASSRAQAGPAPDVRNALLARNLTTIDGQAMGRGELDDRVVVVNFWATWCKPCRMELPALDRLHQEVASRGGMVLAVSIDRDRTKVDRFIADRKLRLPVVHDGADGLAAQLDLPYLPCTYVLDREGRVVEAIGGGGTADLQALRGTVERLLSSSAPAVAGAEGGGQ